MRARQAALQLPDLGEAPELNGSVWIDADAPLLLEELHGKVVALEMWTFACINCQHVIPYLKEWHTDYQDDGLALIANHCPEFGYERDLENLQRAVTEAGIDYAVVQDNEGANWSAYSTSYWPTFCLIDKRGRIRYVHIGEGAYDTTERTVQALLAETYP